MGKTRRSSRRARPRPASARRSQCRASLQRSRPATTSGCAWPAINGPHAPTKVDVHVAVGVPDDMRPTPRIMKRGSPPTARHARTGLFTPAGDDLLRAGQEFLRRLLQVAMLKGKIDSRALATQSNDRQSIRSREIFPNKSLLLHDSRCFLLAMLDWETLEPAPLTLLGVMFADPFQSDR